jgi:transposase-like protein
MEAVEPIVRRRRVRRFRTTEEKRLIVEETRRFGVSVSTVAQAHGINANQVFYWRKLYEAGQLESTVAQSTGDLGARGVRLLSVSVDEGAERQAPVATAASTADHTAGSDALAEAFDLSL